jgi:hypothetical protein
MSQRTTAWQCIGCGRLDSDATCMGVCQDRKVVLVSAADYDEACRQIDELRLFIRQLANVAPRDGEWERSYKALQQRARRLLGTENEEVLVRQEKMLVG